MYSPSRWISTASLILVPATATASPYKITGLHAADTFEIKLETKIESKDGESVLEGPAIDLTAPIARGLEASFTFGPGRLKERGQAARWGVIDTEVAVKWEMLPQPEAGGFGLTIEPAAIAPTGSNGLGGGEWRVEVPLILGWARGPVQVRGQLGYERGLKTGEDEVSFGVVTEYDLSDTLSVGAEVVGGTPSLAVRDYEAQANLGFKLKVASKVELQGRIGRSLRNDDHVPETNVGVFLEFAL